MFSRLISDPDEVSRASELVSAFLAYQFPGTDDYMTWEQFKAFCLEVVSISLVFPYRYNLTHFWIAFIHLLFLPALGHHIHTYHRTASSS